MSDEPKPKTDPYKFVGYLLALAILTPIGWWLHRHLGLADWLRSIGFNEWFQ